MTTDTMIKTYKALRDLRIGHEVRQYGDFVPEAESWKNKHLYLAHHQLEEVYVPQSVVDKWREDFDARQKELAEEEAALEAEVLASVTGTEGGSEIEEEPIEDLGPEVPEAPRVAAKKTARKVVPRIKRKVTG